jgi:hypothetical protein
MTPDDVKLMWKLVDALIEAESHLAYCGYCGYGDEWERECAVPKGLSELLTEVIGNGERRVEHLEKQYGIK